MKTRLQHSLTCMLGLLAFLGYSLLAAELNDQDLLHVATLEPASGHDILDFNDPSSALSQILIPRAVGSSNLTKVQNLLKDHFKGLSTRINDNINTWELFEDTFDAETPYGLKQFSNLVFTHDPSAARKLVVAAHSDSKFSPTPPMDGFVGATDSAVPCAIMLDMASTLDAMLNALVEKWESSSPPAEGIRTTLQFIFFDGEEAFRSWTSQDSIYGAKHLAELWEKPSSTPSPVSPQTDTLSSINALILLDLLGVPGPKMHNFFLDTGYLFDAFSSVEDRLGSAGMLWEGEEGANWHMASVSSSRRIFEPRRSQVDVYAAGIEDDHLPFLRRGVPILHLIPLPFPSVWHTIGDDASCLDLPTIRAWALICRAAVAEYLNLTPPATQATTRRDELTS